MISKINWVTSRSHKIIWKHLHNIARALCFEDNYIPSGSANKHLFNIPGRGCLPENTPFVEEAFPASVYPIKKQTQAKTWELGKKRRKFKEMKKRGGIIVR